MKHLSAPKELFIGVTDRCNLACRHCNVASTKGLKSELSFNEWSAILDEAERMKVFYVTVSGGEPFVRGDIFEIFKKIESTPMRFSVNTNASCIDDRKAEALASFKRLSGVLVGLDGSRAQAHDALRGDGAFFSALRGLKALVGALGGARTTIFCVVNKFNLGDLEGLVRLADDLGIAAVQFEPILWEGSAKENERAIGLSFGERQGAFREVARLHGIYGTIVRGNFLSMGRHFAELDTIDFDRFRSQEKGGCLSSCAAIDKLVIRPDGWVVPCDRLWEFTIEHVHRRSLRDIWNNAPRLEEFRNRYSLHVDDIPECAGCQYRFTCRAGCPAGAFNEGGSIVGRDPASCYRIHKGEEAYDRSV
ncbi:MAG: radical SAM protein [Candidatus Omnitrophota bacterium]